MISMLSDTLAPFSSHSKRGEQMLAFKGHFLTTWKLKIWSFRISPALAILLDSACNPMPYISDPHQGDLRAVGWSGKR
jgi:hypothetical protein